MVGDQRSIPHWLEILLGEKFFNPCQFHQFAKKNEKNIFCLDCCTSICPHCLPHHRPHSLLQVRRYVYHDVIRLGDAQKLVNCSLVQPYTTNSAKVVFLNQRPMSRPFRGSGNFCTTCDRSLQHPYLFCSLSCKVNHQLATSNSTGNCEFLTILPNKARSESMLDIEDDGQMTPDSVLDSSVSLSGSTSASASDGGGISVSAVSCRTTLACTATTEFVKKKRSNINSVSRVPFQPRWSPGTAEIAVALNRRKGVPHRSPLN